VQQLAHLLARLLYGNGDLPPDTMEILERFWDAVTSPVEEAEFVVVE
jgi:hypothetical protein